MKIDNFALSMFQACRAKYYLRMVQGFVPIRRRAALSFGGVIHNGLAEWYRSDAATYVEGAEAAPALVAALQAIEKHWPEVMPTEDFRTKAKALETLYHYSRTYPKEVWSPLATPTGKLVEVAATIPMGLFLECQECEGYMDELDRTTGKCSNCGQPLEEVEYGGILDVGAEWNDMVYVIDHKTTTRLGDGSYYFMQFKPDNQMTGYIWMLQQLSNRRVGGAIINAIGLYKDKPPIFKRQITNRTPDEIERWKGFVLDTCNDIKRCERTGIWREETGSCMQYGSCDYHNVHTLSSEAEREKRLETDYVKNEWNFEERDD